MAKRKPKPKPKPQTTEALADLLKALMEEAKGVAGAAGNTARDFASELGGKAKLSAEEAQSWVTYLRQMLSGGGDLPPRPKGPRQVTRETPSPRSGGRADPIKVSAKGAPKLSTGLWDEVSEAASRPSGVSGLGDIGAAPWKGPKGASMFDPTLGVIEEVAAKGATKAPGLLSRAASMGAKGLGMGLRALGPVALASMVIPEIYDRVANPEERAHRGQMNLAAYDALTEGAYENQLLREIEQENEDLQGDIRGEFGRQVSGRNRDLDDIARLLDSQKEQLRASQPYAAREGPSLMEIYAAEGLL